MRNAAVIAAFVSSALALPAVADTIYHCGYKNGAPVYKITSGKPGAGCRAINRPRKPGRRIPGARCRSQRYGETVMHCCEKDGIRRCYNTNRRTRSGRARVASRTGPGVADEPVMTENVYAGTGDIKGIVARASSKYDVPVALVNAVIHVESRFNADAVSPVGAQGLMQLMPVTADFMDVSDPFDPEQNVMAGTRLLRRLADRFDGDLELTLAAYYAGPTAVKRAGGIPTEQCAVYVGKVLDAYRTNMNHPETPGQTR